MLNSFLSSLKRSACAAALASIAVISPANAADLNALIWCDHADPALLKPFEDANGIKVNLKVYEGTGQALSLIEQSQPGDWDVLVIDAIDVPRVAAKAFSIPCRTTSFRSPISSRRSSWRRKPSGRQALRDFGEVRIQLDLLQQGEVDPADMQAMAILGTTNTRAGSRSMTITCR